MTMGVTISKLWGQNIKYTGDSTTGLTAEEKQILSDSFSVLKQDLSKSGERLFIIFMTDYPDNKKYFRDFKDMTIDELKGSPLFLAHATNVMSSLSGMISLLNEPESLVAIIQKIGKNHGRRNLEDQAFEDLKATFAKLLQEKLKDKLTNNVMNVWGKTFDVIVAVFKQGIEQSKKENSS